MRSKLQLGRGMRTSRIVAIAVVAALSILTSQAHAAERVTLSNGFVEQCDHHALVDGRVRLYLSAGEDSYIEFPAG